MEESCIFCKIAAKEIDSSIVYEDDKVAAFRDISPKAPVHILIIPKMHIGFVSELNASTAPIVGDMVLAANKLAKSEGISEGGYRLVLNCGPDSGQEVFHIHMHLLGGRKLSWPPG